MASNDLIHLASELDCLNYRDMRAFARGIYEGMGMASFADHSDQTSNLADVLSEWAAVVRDSDSD